MKEKGILTQRVVNFYHLLPLEVVEADSITRFRNDLEKLVSSRSIQTS